MTLPHRRAFADDLVDGHQAVDRLAQLHVFLAQPAPLHCPQHQVAELVGIDRLGDVVEGPVLQRPHRRIHGGEGRDHDHGGLRVDLAELLLELHAVHAGHLDVQQHHLVAVLLHGPQRFRGVLRRLHFVTVLAEPLAEGVAGRKLVVHDQDACSLAVHGDCWSPSQSSLAFAGPAGPHPSATGGSSCRPARAAAAAADGTPCLARLSTPR